MTPALERALADEPELLKMVDRANLPIDPDDYPKPDLEFLTEEHERLKAEWQPFHDLIRAQRVGRFLKDKIPEKWSRQLEIGEDQYVRSRLAHNMILRITALATQNPPRYAVKPSGDKDADEARAKKQAQWLNGLWPSIERARAKRRELIDNQCGDGLGILEIYRTGKYDSITTDEYEDESAPAYKKRMRSQWQRAGDPYAIRRVDPLSSVFDEDLDEDDPTCTWFIEEVVSLPALNRKLRGTMSAEEHEKWRNHELRKRSGSPTGGTFSPGETATCVRYYDRRWTAYMVDGYMVEEPQEHGLGFVPIVVYEGMTTGSPDRTERYQGVFWGMFDLEQAVNWLTTLDVDNAFVLSKPKLVVTTPLNASEQSRLIQPNALPASAPVDFSGGKAPRLRPGEQIQNLTENFRGHDTGPVVARIMQLIQVSGLNPVAQGESPGSDPAGYAINALQSAAQSNYEVILDNASRGDSQLGNKLRAIIKRELRQPWYLSSLSRRGGRKGGQAWLALEPDDVDDVNCTSVIDPLGAVNRMAIQQALRQGNKEGFVARWRVQEAYGVEDYDMEDDDIAEDALDSELLRMAIEFTKSAILQVEQGQNPELGLVDAQGNPLGPSGGPGGQEPQQTANGAQPAPISPPSVGGPAAAASAGGFETRPGPAAQSAQTARAGFDQGRRPPGVGVPG